MSLHLFFLLFFLLRCFFFFNSLSGASWAPRMHRHIPIYPPTISFRPILNPRFTWPLAVTVYCVSASSALSPTPVDRLNTQLRAGNVNVSGIWCGFGECSEAPETSRLGSEGVPAVRSFPAKWELRHRRPLERQGALRCTSHLAKQPRYGAQGRNLSTIGLANLCDPSGIILQITFSHTEVEPVKSILCLANLFLGYNRPLQHLERLITRPMGSLYEIFTLGQKQSVIGRDHGHTSVCPHHLQIAPLLPLVPVGHTLDIIIGTKLSVDEGGGWLAGSSGDKCAENEDSWKNSARKLGGHASYMSPYSS
ncbi:hypothetical protein B0H13DRAFT_2418607 [Mycena leptocephala]|nr:hypothetical protein B0H13DRAFT_2418607 [Mycena leptocephala]